MKNKNFMSSWCLFFLCSGFTFASDIPLSFETALQEILARSTEKWTAEAQIHATYFKNLPTPFTFLPTLSLYAQEPLHETPDILGGNKRLTLESQWNIFRWGADFINLRISNAEQNEKQAYAEKIILEIEMNAITALITQIQITKEIKIHTEIVNNRKNLLHIAQERYQKGYLPLQEVEKLTLDLENDQASLRTQEIKEEESRAHVENLLGHSHLINEWPWVSHLQKLQDSSLLTKPFELFHRPDWREAHSKVEVKTYQEQRLWRLLLPSLDLKMSYGYYQWSTLAPSAASVNVSLQLTVPLFDHLIRYSQAREKAYARLIEEAQLEGIQRKAKAEWMASQNNLKKSIQFALSREVTLKIAHKLYHENLTRFQSGHITANDLAMDAKRVYETELLSIQSWSLAHKHYTQLCHAHGNRVATFLSTMNHLSQQ